MEIKLHDIFSFRYNELETKKRFELYHCFDGTLIARKRDNGDIYLQDTYWGASDSRTFTADQATKQGTLTFICNSDEVEKCNEYDKDYYDDADFIILYIHHGYRNQFYLRKGAVRSKEKMLESIKRKIEETENKKRYAEYDIINYNKTQAEIENNNLSVYI